MSATAVSRDQVEQLVRSIIRKQLGDGATGPGPSSSLRMTITGTVAWRATWSATAP